MDQPTDVERMRINHATDERLKELVEGAGFSITDEDPPPIHEILTAVRRHARKVIDLAVWRLEQADAIGRELTYDEVESSALALDAILYEVGRVATRRMGYPVMENVRLSTISRTDRPGWLAEWNAANPGRADNEGTVLAPGDVVRFPIEWADSQAETNLFMEEERFSFFLDSLRDQNKSLRAERNEPKKG